MKVGGTLIIRKNGVFSSHIYDGPYNEFNVWTLSKM